MMQAARGGEVGKRVLGMNRKQRAAMAAETDAIVEAGGYQAPGGGWVDLSRAVETAVGRARHLLESETRRLAGAPGARRLPCTLTSRTTLAAMAEGAARGEAVIALNFASARNPGGGYRGGSEAQEESLARSSALVATQEARMSYYHDNRSHKSTLYRDAMIFSPEVPVFRDEDGVLLDTPYVAGIITAPAPNAGALRSDDERGRAAETLRRRMRAVLALAAEAGADRLILGAWGCGVFRNDPDMVARLWAGALDEAPEGGLSAGVEMAVYDPSRDGAVWRAFEAVFGGSGHPR